tara:strand:+ start:320 stop:1426 length:1107 start_codon:yes stop_codon:yes gene_type:complete
MDISKEIYLAPYFCYINLTSKCNLKCKHCFGSYSTPHKNELTLNGWKKVIDNLLRHNVFFVNLSGGEITQSPFFREFILYLTRKGMHFILTTNGIFSRSIRDFIVENKEYLIGIKISLDGPDAESHGFIRLDFKEKYNPKIFNITMENIFFFRDKEIPLTISTVLHKRNIKRMDEFQKLIKEINPVSWFISPIIPVGRGNTNKFISEFYECFDNESWEEIVKQGRKNKIDVRMIDMPIEMEKEGLSAYNCAAALNFCEIHSDGTVSPCTLCRVCIPRKFLKFENIKDKSLQEIWYSKIFNEFRSYMDIGCKGCKMLPKCNKCIAQSFRYFEDGKSPTPFCIKNGKVLEIENLDKFKQKLKENFNLNIK